MRHRFVLARIRGALAALALPFVMATAAAPLSAQEPTPSSADVIRGRVTDDSARAIAAATVIVTRGPDRATLEASTDSAGNYSVRFEPGTGDYLVYVSAPGYRTARRRVQRQGGEVVLVADFRLGSEAAMLAEVKVRAQKPVRAKNDVSPYDPETGASERYQDGVDGQLPPGAAGDLNATATTMSGVTATPNGPSILGAGAESNLTTLNGMGMAAATIPRAAQTETRVTGATFDPTRGGFAGANIDVRLASGDRFYQRRQAYLTLDPRQFQLTDAVGRAAGIPSGGLRASIGGNGELIRQALTYNAAIDVSRSISTPSTLVDADDATLLRAGVAPDSVARLRALAGPLGILAAGGVPADRQRDGLTFLGRLDDTRDTLATRTMTTYAGLTKEGALGFGPLAAPASGGEQRQRTLGLQLVAGEYFGPGRNWLNETRFAASQVKTTVSPYLELPGASVLVRSPSLDPTARGGLAVTDVALGGSPSLFTDSRRWTVEGSNETMRNARGSRHRLKGQLWGRADGLAQAGGSNRFGSYGYNSIADFAANNPASFSRTLSQPDRSGRVWNVAGAAAHQWLPTRLFSVLYGARVEGSGFFDAPSRDAALESALGVRTGVAPARLHLSPRAGFTWTYNHDKDNGSGMRNDNMGRFYRNRVGTVRGGIGDFRDLLRPELAADASPSEGSLLLSCVGSAVPAADWDLFAADPANIPAQCAGGGGVLAERAPAVTLIDPGYDVPHSWRASLDWSTDVGHTLLKLGALGSWDLSQPGRVDANFAGRTAFTLDPAAEGGRPVYVTTGSIDPGSGVVSAAESRRSPAWSRVGVRTSDLRGYGGQFTATIAPDIFKARIPFYGALSYTLQSTKRQYRGFDGAGFGDPRTKEWAPNANDARHAFTLQGGFSSGPTGSITLFSRVQSGLPFTPIVQGDVNGDGLGGDRAFVPAPGASGDPSLDAQLRALLATGSASARDCVRANLGRVTPRNGCRGPWTETLNVQWSPPVPQKWARRVRPNVYLENVLGGVDQLVHGSGGLRGWGSQARPDPVLLIPRGFDATASRFRYDVNPRFADTRPGRTLFRSPFRISIDFSIDLSVDYPLQELRRALEPVRGPNRTWVDRGADSLAAFYLSRTSSIYKALLEQSDSLFLTKTQVAQLQRADSVYSARVRALYIPLGEFLAGRRGNEPGKTELDSAAVIDKAYWKVFWEQPEIADSIVTPTQKELFPMLPRMVGIPKKEREHSQWQFGHPVTFNDDKPRAPSVDRGVQVRNQ
ncbi:MAG TPA: carboxypeptidase-like regulatory domain-containing protein [Gemmatimonadaceae bacterium]|nr:carboxypeptidase-like regulatory domain-containing protein [Gemmatimonadaceae bacterium]